MNLNEIENITIDNKTEIDTHIEQLQYENMKIQETPKNDLQELIDKNKDSVIKTIEEQPKVGEWIPCSQLFPLDGVNVLITDEYNNMSVGFFEIGMGRWHNIYDCIILDEIIAWKPLPEPYKGD